ncbi:MAG TPA: DUF2911 domain-containing protein [Gemmatimonadaceae bacterium]|jgi:hypothetical protein
MAVAEHGLVAAARAAVATSALLATFVTLATGAFAPCVSAQVVASERATVTQTIDGTHFTIDYSRPRTRGRDSVLGKLEPWGRTWTPGANQSTTLEINRPIHLLGRLVPAGKYSVWLTLREKGPWTFVLDPRSTLFHTATVDSTPQQIRAPVVPKWGGNTDALTWTFPEVSSDAATLQMQWGHVTIRAPIEVTPAFARTITPAAAAPYLGEYDFKMAAGSAPPDRMTIQLHGDTLFARTPPDKFGDAENFELLPVSQDRFVAASLLIDDIGDTNADVVFQFRREGDKVTGFDWMSGTRVMATGVRRPR